MSSTQAQTPENIASDCCLVMAAVIAAQMTGPGADAFNAKLDRIRGFLLRHHYDTAAELWDLVRAMANTLAKASITTPESRDARRRGAMQ